MAGPKSSTAVLAAIAGNSMVMVTKFVAFLVTGSGAMLSEGIHSFADVLNQSLLFLGIWASHKPPDAEYPYGYDRERFVWAIISAVGIFFLGAGVTAYHGVASLFNPPTITNVFWAFFVLALSFVFEGFVLAIAVNQLKRAAKGRPFFTFLHTEADPSVVAVFLEDSVALFGITAAFAAIALTRLTGNPIWDSIGSITIALLLTGVAGILISQNRRMLLGVAMPAREREKVFKVLRDNPAVEAVYDFKSRLLSVDKYQVKMEVEFEGHAIARNLNSLIAKAYPQITTYEQFQKFCEDFADKVIEALGDEIDRIEEQIRQQVPAVKHVDIETD
ncbi:MAG: cation diffusion facilitator family transporter [Pseudomonadota bacterium]